jgi:hypothetical protein
MVLGVPTLTQLFNDRFYEDLGGGVLEALGRLYSGPVRLYIYPWRNDKNGELVTAESFRIADQYAHLHRYLLENKMLEPLAATSGLELSLLPRDVLSRMQARDPGWEALVPKAVVSAIKEHGLFGSGGSRQPEAPTRGAANP